MSNFIEQIYTNKNDKNFQLAPLWTIYEINSFVLDTINYNVDYTFREFLKDEENYSEYTLNEISDTVSAHTIPFNQYINKYSNLKSTPHPKYLRTDWDNIKKVKGDKQIENMFNNKNIFIDFYFALKKFKSQSSAVFKNGVFTNAVFLDSSYKRIKTNNEKICIGGESSLLEVKFNEKELYFETNSSAPIVMASSDIVSLKFNGAELNSKDFIYLYLKRINKNELKFYKSDSLLSYENFEYIKTLFKNENYEIFCLSLAFYGNRNMDKNDFYNTSLYGSYGGALSCFVAQNNNNGFFIRAVIGTTSRDLYYYNKFLDTTENKALLKFDNICPFEYKIENKESFESIFSNISDKTYNYINNEYYKYKFDLYNIVKEKTINTFKSNRVLNYNLFEDNTRIYNKLNTNENRRR